MNEILYPSHLNVTQKTEGASQFLPPNPYQTPSMSPSPLLQGQPQPSYPMPQLPQSFQSPQRYDVELQNGQPQATQIAEPYQAHLGGKLLQEVVWSNPIAGSVAPASPFTQNLNINEHISSAYPPMPPVAGQAQAAQPSQPVMNGASIGTGVEDHTGNFLGAVRQHLASRPKDEPSKPMSKAIIEKATTEVVADPKKPRSPRAVFLTGALFGMVVAFALMMTLGQIVRQNDYVSVAASASNEVPIDVTPIDITDVSDNAEFSENSTLNADE